MFYCIILKDYEMHFYTFDLSKITFFKINFKTEISQWTFIEQKNKKSISLTLYIFLHKNLKNPDLKSADKEEKEKKRRWTTRKLNRLKQLFFVSIFISQPKNSIFNFSFFLLSTFLLSIPNAVKKLLFYFILEG